MAHGYEIGVHLVAHNGVSGVLAAISKDLLGLQGPVAQLTKGISGLHAGVLGAMAGLAGAGIVAGMAKVVGHGNELVKIQRDMAQAGVQNTQIQTAYNEAWKLTGKYTNMGAADIMRFINDARMTFGDQDAATHHVEPFIESASYLKSYFGTTKGGAASASLHAEINAAMKSGEIAGKISPEEMREHVQQLTAMRVAYGDQLKIGQYLTAQRAAGVALRNTSDSFRYGMFPALVQENGVNAGMMLMTAFNKVVAGVGNRTSSLQEMERLGLLNKEQVKYDKVGRAIGLKDPDGIKGSHEAAMHFGDWVMTTLKPLLDKQSGGDHVREAQLISKMFPDRNAAKAITEIVQQASKFARNSDQMANARKSMNAKVYNEGSLDYQIQSFHTQWANLMQTLGAPIVSAATSALNSLNEAMSSFSQWGAANPAAMKAIAYTITGIGAVLATLGTVLVGGAIAAAIGLLAPAIAAIGTAISAIAPIFFAARLPSSRTSSRASRNGSPSWASARSIRPSCSATPSCRSAP